MSATERHPWSQARSSYKDDQRRLIAETAFGILLEGGASGLTMASLADRAGISRQTLYRYFPDLDSVLIASVDGLIEADAAFREVILSKEDPHDQIHYAIDALIDATQHDGARIDEFLAALPPDARSGIEDHRTRTIALIGEILSRLKRRRHQLYDGDPLIDAELILGLVSAADDRSRARTHHIVDVILTSSHE